MSSILLALPSKGRLYEQMNKFFESSGIILKRSGGQRTYSGFIKGIEKIEIIYLSASEISSELLKGNIHMGITGIDLIEWNDEEKMLKLSVFIRPFSALTRVGEHMSMKLNAMS